MYDIAGDDRLGHFFRSCCGRRLDGVHVDVALYVREFQQPGQSMIRGGPQFLPGSPAVPEDQVEFEPGIDFFLGPSRHGLLGFQIRQAVLAEGETHLEGALP